MLNPDYISDDTLEETNCIRDIAISADMDIGVAMCAEENGDCMWYVLINHLNDVSVILCSPYGVFTQDTIGLKELGDFNYSIVSGPAKFLDHMKNLGFRGLSPDELEDWINGEF